MQAPHEGNLTLFILKRGESSPRLYSPFSFSFPPSTLISQRTNHLPPVNSPQCQNHPWSYQPYPCNPCYPCPVKTIRAQPSPAPQKTRVSSVSTSNSLPLIDNAKIRHPLIQRNLDMLLLCESKFSLGLKQFQKYFSRSQFQGFP